MSKTIEGVTTLNVRGTEVSVDLVTWENASAAGASFNASIAGKEVTAPTLAELRDKLTALTKRRAVKVSIPFGQLTQYGYGQTRRLRFRRGRLTGIHAGTDNLLVKWDDNGGTDQLTRSGGVAYRELTGAQVDELLRLTDAVESAQRELRAFDDAHTLQLREAVEAAITAAVEKDAD